MTRSIHPRDLLQPPTAITAASFALVLDGSTKLDTPTGKAEVIAGRLGDIADGYVARRYNMTSDAGAIADVTCDKLGVLAIGIGMWRHDIAPKPLLAAMVAKHTLNAAATLYNGINDPERRAIRPPRSGKYSMAADNLSLGAFLIADELDTDSTAYNVARGIGYAAAAAGLAFGLVSTRHYIRGEFDEAPASKDADLD